MNDVQRVGANGVQRVEPVTWCLGSWPLCHDPDCKNDARWRVSFGFYEEYRCDKHKPVRSAGEGA